ncbi:hypothetical protein PMAC_001163 [Pneumocystis sp. 'macacae']|nr:hypothetical protein PMAC_001163 [Pneumocystis sp. 'macacae']
MSALKQPLVLGELRKDKRKHRTHIGPWQLGRTLGHGSTGRVRLAKHSVTGQLAAVKIVPKNQPAESSALCKDKGGASGFLHGIEREVVIMKLIDHPNVMRLYDVWENKNELYLILEYIEGGELFDYLVQKGKLEEREAVGFNICHRDLKPENLLLDKHRNIKIADFGMAALQPFDRMLETSCGSPHYASPEIVAGKIYHGAPSDIWSCGIILFALLTGHLPFDDENVRQLLLKVKAGQFVMPSKISPEGKDLIWRMLDINPHTRIKMTDILKHPFLSKYNHFDTLLDNPSKIPTLDELKRPVQKRDEIDAEILKNLQTLWRNVSKEVIINRLLSEEVNPEKTFYYLLLKYRKERMQYYENCVEFVNCSRESSVSQISKLTSYNQRPLSVHKQLKESVSQCLRLSTSNSRKNLNRVSGIFVSSSRKRGVDFTYVKKKNDSVCLESKGFPKNDENLSNKRDSVNFFAEFAAECETAFNKSVLRDSELRNDAILTSKTSPLTHCFLPFHIHPSSTISKEFGSNKMMLKIYEGNNELASFEENSCKVPNDLNSVDDTRHSKYFVVKDQSKLRVSSLPEYVVGKYKSVLEKRAVSAPAKSVDMAQKKSKEKKCVFFWKKKSSIGFSRVVYPTIFRIISKRKENKVSSGKTVEPVIQQSFFAKVLNIKSNIKSLRTILPFQHLYQEIANNLKKWEHLGIGITNVRDNIQLYTVHANISNSMKLRAIRFRVEVSEQGNGSIARFFLEKGINSSFQQLVKEFELILGNKHVLDLSDHILK